MVSDRSAKGWACSWGTSLPFTLYWTNTRPHPDGGCTTALPGVGHSMCTVEGWKHGDKALTSGCGHRNLTNDSQNPERMHQAVWNTPTADGKQLKIDNNLLFPGMVTRPGLFRLFQFSKELRVWKWRKTLLETNKQSTKESAAMLVGNVSTRIEIIKAKGAAVGPWMPIYLWKKT